MSTGADEGYIALRGAPDAMADLGPAKVTYLIEIAGEEIEANGVIDLASEAVAISFELPDGSGAIEMVTHGLTMYMKVPEGGEGEFGVTTPWISFDLERAGRAVSGMGQLPSSGDPTDALSGLRGAAKDGVREVGRERVRGVETTRYDADVDLRSALEEMGDIEDREAFEEYIEQFGKEDAEYDVWLDDDGVVRKMAMEMTIEGQRMKMTVEFYDFGKVQAPGVPAPKDVTDVTDQLISQQQAEPDQSAA